MDICIDLINLTVTGRTGKKTSKQNVGPAGRNKVNKMTGNKTSHWYTVHAENLSGEQDIDGPFIQLCSTINITNIFTSVFSRPHLIVVSMQLKCIDRN